MSKRHQSSRRRTYGRRQHELRERIDRVPPADEAEFGGSVGDTERDGFSFIDADPTGRRLSFAVGD
jgi:hypothetical protein